MRKRSRPGKPPDTPPLLRSPKYRPVLGCVQVVPPQELPDGSLLRVTPPGHCLRSGAYIAAIKKRDQNKISPIRVSTLSGEPRTPAKTALAGNFVTQSPLGPQPRQFV